MGIFINLSISKSVTKDEWERVYEETLQLIKHLPLAERRRVKIRDIDTICIVRTEEQGDGCGWNATGDYNTMHTAENYFMPRDIVGNHKVEPDAGDAIDS